MIGRYTNVGRLFTEFRVKSRGGVRYNKIMKNTNIRPGDRVILAAVNGLGSRPFTVLEANRKDIIHDLYVQGDNGQAWPARSEGARILPRQ